MGVEAVVGAVHRKKLPKGGEATGDYSSLFCFSTLPPASYLEHLCDSWIFSSSI